MDNCYPELGYFGLPGWGTDPSQLYGQVRTGEAMGLGSIWLSERFGSKHAAVLSGAVAAISSRLGIATGLIANLPLRHPLVTAGYASTMMGLSGGRFALGLSRGQNTLADASSTPRISLDYLEDYIAIMRRLWRGERVHHDGPAGKLENLSLGTEISMSPPVIMAVMGDKSAYWAGRVADGVLLYSWSTAQAIAHFKSLIKKGAEHAKRDPSRIKLWSIVITACELPEEEMLAYVVGRLNQIIHVPNMFGAICDANGWDRTIAAKARAAMHARGLEHKDWLKDGPLTQGDRDDFQWSRGLFPDEWFSQGAAIGSPIACARSLQALFAAGLDGVVLHTGNPVHLISLLTAWQAVRPANLFDGRSMNPGL